MTVGVKDQFNGTANNDVNIMEVDATWGAGQSTINAYTGQAFSIAGLNRSFDRYNGNGGFDSLNGTGGSDALVYDTTGDALDSDPAHYVSIEQFSMGPGNDVINLTSGPNGSASYAGATNLFGGAGNDIILAGGGAQLLVGDFNVTTGGSLSAGADFLYGGAGNDTIFGDGRSLGAGVALADDVIDGGTGNDLLFGDGQTWGTDFTGSRGHNTFIFDGPGSGQDTIGTGLSNGFANGFQHGLDHLQLDPSYGYTAAQALAHTVDNASGNAVVDLGHGDSITLAGVHAADLTTADFTIAPAVPFTATSITGLTAASVNDNQTVQPFSTVTLTDANANATESVTITWNGANGTLTSGSTVYRGSYSVSGATATVQAALRGLTFTPTANQVAPGSTVTTTFSIADTNGAAQQSSATDTVTATSVNDPATIAGTATGSVTEDGTKTASGTLTVTDPDLGQATFASTTTSTSAYGAFTFTPGTGAWTYTLNNGSTAVQSLAAGQKVTDTLGVTSLDGTANRTVTVTITGVNDAAIIAGTATGAVTEDGTASASGQLTVSDADTGQASFQPPSSAALTGSYGAFTFDPGTGKWGYALNNGATAVQSLAAGQTATDALTVTSVDGTATQAITVTITGTNDAVTIVTGSTTATGAFTERAQTTGSTTADTASGSIAFADTDRTDTHTVSQGAPSFAWSGGTLSAAQQNALAAASTLTLNKSETGGAGAVAWTYSAADRAFDFLAQGDTLTATYVVTLDDGHGSTVVQPLTVTVTGAIDAPTIAGTVAGQTTTDTVPIKPFASVAVTSPDANAQDSLTITLTNAQGQLTDANGTLSGTGLSKVAGTVGTYQLAATNPSALSSTLDALTFTPAKGVKSGQTVSTGFTLTASQTESGTTATATDSTTTVVVSPGLNPIDGPARGYGLLIGTKGADAITAHGQFNAIFGLGGDDVVNAGAGYAVVTLGNGNASVTLGGSGNVVIGGNGNSTVTGAPGGYTAVTLGDGNNTVTVGGSYDVILLGNGTNMVSGTTGMAFIKTGSGNDTITLGGSGSTVNAGAGINLIRGGTGSDTFVLPAASQGFDTITGFTETNGDVLDLRAALAATSWNRAESTLGDFLKVTNGGGNTNLAIAPDGGGASTAIATLSGVSYGLNDLLSHHSVLTT